MVWIEGGDRGAMVCYRRTSRGIAIAMEGTERCIVIVLEGRLWGRIAETRWNGNRRGHDKWLLLWRNVLIKEGF